jgi:hypothetical protein
MGTEQEGKQTQRSQTEVDIEILSSDRLCMFVEIFSAFPIVAQKYQGENFVISDRLCGECGDACCETLMSHKVR